MSKLKMNVIPVLFVKSDVSRCQGIRLKFLFYVCLCLSIHSFCTSFIIASTELQQHLWDT